MIRSVVVKIVVNLIVLHLLIDNLELLDIKVGLGLHHVLIDDVNLLLSVNGLSLLRGGEALDFAPLWDRLFFLLSERVKSD